MVKLVNLGPKYAQNQKAFRPKQADQFTITNEILSRIKIRKDNAE